MKAPTLHELLDQFNTIRTWTKEKKRLKNKVIENIQKEKLYVFVGSKHLFKMTRFGEIRKIFSKELSFLKPKTFKAKEVELVCMGQEHFPDRHYLRWHREFRFKELTLPLRKTA